MSAGRAGRNVVSRTLLRLVNKSVVSQLLIGIAAVIGALVVIGASGRQLWRSYDEHFRWARHVNHTLESLRPNTTVDEFDERLGRPRIVTRSPSGLTTQRIYQGRGYWVQAVADETQSVVMFAITACDDRLTPSWKVWNGRDGYVSVVLNSTSVVNELPIAEAEYKWYVSPATANSYVYAHYGGGNVTKYLSYAWGANDACRGKGLQISAADRAALAGSHELGEAKSHTRLTGLTSEATSALSHVVANTFAIYGLQQSPENLEFQVGADRVLTGNLEQPR